MNPMYFGKTRILLCADGMMKTQTKLQPTTYLNPHQCAIIKHQQRYTATWERERDKRKRNRSWAWTKPLLLTLQGCHLYPHTTFFFLDAFCHHGTLFVWVSRQCCTDPNVISYCILHQMVSWHRSSQPSLVPTLCPRPSLNL